VADDAPLPEGAVLVSLARFQKDREALLARNTPIGSSCNPARIRSAGRRSQPFFPDCAGIPQIPRRPRLFLGPDAAHPLGFTGEIRAVGDFLYDQVNYQHRVGFDAWEVPDISP
jgi:uncharacterized protein (DUF934 family)